MMRRMCLWRVRRGSGWGEVGSADGPGREDRRVLLIV